MHTFSRNFFAFCVGLFCTLPMLSAPAWASLFSTIELKDYQVLAVEGLSDSIEGENTISFSKNSKKLVTLSVGKGHKEEFAKLFTEEKYTNAVLEHEEMHLDNDNNFTVFTVENKDHDMRSLTIFADDGNFFTVTTYACAPHLPYILYGLDSNNPSLKNIFFAITAQEKQTGDKSWETWLKSAREPLPKFDTSGPMLKQIVSFANMPPHMKFRTIHERIDGGWLARKENNFIVISPQKGHNENDLWVSIMPYSTPQDANLNEHFYEKMYYALRDAGIDSTTRRRYYGGEYAFYTPTGGIGNASLMGDYALITVQNNLGCSSQMADYFSNYFRKTVRHLSFMQAIEKGDVAAVKKYIQNGADVNFVVNAYTPLAKAAQHNSQEIMQILLKHGALVDGDPKNSSNWTAMAVATLKNDVPMVKMLIEHKADVNHTSQGTVPLLRAMMKVFTDQSELVQLLLDHGADPNKARQYVFTPIQYAVRGARVKYLPMLLAKGADLHVRDQYQKTLLMLIAAQYPTDDGIAEEDKRKTMQFLIDNKIDIHAVDERGRTALMEAARHATKENVEVLLKNGANPNMKDNYGRTALYYAKRSPEKGVMAILRKYGAKETP